MFLLELRSGLCLDEFSLTLMMNGVSFHLGEVNQGVGNVYGICVNMLRLSLRPISTKIDDIPKSRHALYLQ
jgi:hypothetical protein